MRTTKETITISWTEGGPATESYSVEMSENSDSDYKLIKSKLKGNTFTAEGLNPNSSYKLVY